MIQLLMTLRREGARESDNTSDPGRAIGPGSFRASGPKRMPSFDVSQRRYSAEPNQCSAVRLSGRPEPETPNGLRASVGFVDESEILVHPLGIDGALEHKQVLRTDEAMLEAGLEMKLVARLEHL